MAATSRHPVNFSALNKGDIISVKELEQIFQAPEGDDKHAFAALKLRKEVEEHFERRGGCPTVVVRKGVGICILTDQEASPYAAKHFDKGLRTLGKAQRQLLGVDRGKLSDEMRPHHDRSVTVQGAYLASLEETRKQLYLPSTQRNSPGLLGGEQVDVDPLDDSNDETSEPDDDGES